MVITIQSVKSYFDDWTTWELVWLWSFTALILVLSYLWDDTWIGIVTSLTGIWCVVLVAKARISNYYVGIPNVILYAYLAYGWKYYGEVMLNLGYFLPAQFVGLYFWNKKENKKDRDTVYVKLLSWEGRWWLFMFSSVAVIIYGTFLDYIGGSLPYFDATSTVLSVIAMYMMIKLYGEQWILWIIVNVTSIILWVFVLTEGGVEVTIVLMWTAYLFNAVYGWRNWIKLHRTQGPYGQDAMLNFAREEWKLSEKEQVKELTRTDIEMETRDAAMRLHRVDE